ncbi:MAG: AAA family ATPase, partial [Myxococcota bacterium]
MNTVEDFEEVSDGVRAMASPIARLARYDVVSRREGGGRSRIEYHFKGDQPLAERMGLATRALTLATSLSVASEEEVASALEPRSLEVRELDGREVPTLIAGALEGGEHVCTLRQWMGGDGMDAEVSDVLRVLSILAAALVRAHRTLVVRALNPSSVLLVFKHHAPAYAAIPILSRASPFGSGALRWESMSEEQWSYLSPEQSMRGGHVIGARSDLYALGIIAYEALSGRLPYHARGSDLASWHAAHLTHKPLPLDGVPAALAALVSRLLSKDPGGRYQSARGVLHDLERLASGDEGFDLGEVDAPSEWSPGDGHHGRGAELARVVDAVHATRGTSAARVILIEGPSGYGKTSFARAVHRALAASPEGILSAQGKFEHRNGGERHRAPSSALREALEELRSYLFALGDEELEECRRSLGRRLGADAEVLVEWAPNLNALVVQPEGARARRLGPSRVGVRGAGERLGLALATFVREVQAARDDATILMTLDDIQWADEESVALLTDLLRRKVFRGSAVLLLSRSGSVGERPPPKLVHALEELSTRGLCDFDRLQLEALSPEDVEEMLSSVIGPLDLRSRTLAHQVWVAAQGHPYVSALAFERLHADGAIRFDRREHLWRVDDRAVDSLPLAEGASALIRSRLDALEPEERAVVAWISARGAEVDQESLEHSIAMSWGEQEAGFVSSACDAAWGAKLIVPGLGDAAQGARWRIVHDSVHSLVRSSVGEESWSEMRLRWAVMLLGDALKPDSSLGFDAVALAVEVGGERFGRLTAAGVSERDVLEVVSVATSRALAHNNAAYVSALLAEIDASIVERSMWPVRLKLNYAAALALEYPSARGLQLELAREMWSVACEGVDLERRAHIEAERVELLTHVGRHREAFHTAIDVLALIDPVFARRPAVALGLRLPGLLWRLRRGGVAGLEASMSARQIEDGRVSAAMRLMHAATPSAFFQDTQAFVLFGVVGMLWSLEHGVDDTSSFWCSIVAMVLVQPALGRQYRLAFELGGLAQRMSEHSREATRVRVCIAALSYAHHWGLPAREAFLGEGLNYHWGVRRGAELGEHLWSGYNAMSYFDHMLYVGDPLGQVLKRMEELYPVIVKSGQRDAVAMCTALLGAAHSMAGDTESLGDMGWAPKQGRSHHDVEAMVREGERDNDVPAFVFDRLSMQLLVMSGDYGAAHLIARRTASWPKGTAGELIEVEHAFYHALLELLERPRMGVVERLASARSVSRLMSLMRRWASLGSGNFASRLALLEALAAQRAGAPEGVTARSFGSARRQAERAGHLNVLALVELVWLELAVEAEDASEVSARWPRVAAAWGVYGAYAASRGLEERFSRNAYAAPSATDGMSGLGDVELFDARALMDASALLNESTRAPEVLGALVRILSERSQATRLIVCRDAATLDGGQPRWVVELDARSDTRASFPGAPLDSLPWLKPMVLAASRGESPENVSLARGSVGPPSVMCVALASHVVLYAEHDELSKAFDAGTRALVGHLGAVFAAALERAYQSEELERRNTELLHALASKDAFLRVAFHEMRTPLNAIKGYAELVGEEIADGRGAAVQQDMADQLEEDLERIYASCEHMLALVQNGFMASQIQANGGID